MRVFRIFVVFSLFLTLLGYSIAFGADPVDVTDKIIITKSRLMYDRRTKESYLDIQIQNNSPDTIVSPVKLVISDISTDLVTVANADGLTDDNKTFLIMTCPNNLLGPGDYSETKHVIFNNPQRARFIFQINAFGVVSLIRQHVQDVTVNIPNLSLSNCTVLGINESELDSNGEASVIIPSDFYSFIYLLDESENIVGISVNNPNSNNLVFSGVGYISSNNTIDLNSTAKALVLSLPINWGKYDMQISDVLELIDSSVYYEALVDQVAFILNNEPSKLISLEHQEIWDTAVNIIKEIIENETSAKNVSQSIAKAQPDLLSSYSDTGAVIEDAPGPEVIVKNYRSTPYGISSINASNWNVKSYSGFNKRPYFTPGQDWVDGLFYAFGGEAPSVKYKLGPGHYITCVAKCPFSFGVMAGSKPIASAALLLSDSDNRVAFSEMVNYFYDKKLPIFDKIRIDAQIKASVALELQATILALGFVPAEGDIIKVVGNGIIDIANSDELNAISTSISVYRTFESGFKLVEVLKAISQQQGLINSTARKVATKYLGNENNYKLIGVGAKKLSVCLEVLGTVLLAGDIADALLLAYDSEFAKDYDYFEIWQDASGFAAIYKINPVNFDLEVEILNPKSGDIFYRGQPILFSGEAYDFFDNSISSEDLEWSSSIDGLFGFGSSLTIYNDLSVGKHTITLTAIDGGGQEKSDSVELIQCPEVSYSGGVPIIPSPYSGGDPNTPPECYEGAYSY